MIPLLNASILHDFYALFYHYSKGGHNMSGFKTKARTVELLGRKQIRDSVTALAELMKNAPLLNGIRNSLSKASIEKKDVEKYIASFKCGTILHIDQLHDDWNRYISPISSETRRNDVMLEKMYNRFASFISTFKHTVTEGLPFEVEIYIDGSLWEEDYDFTEDDYSVYCYRAKPRLHFQEKAASHFYRMIHRDNFWSSH